MIKQLKFQVGDFYGGVTAAIVALPLALAFGVASGLGPMAGLYGAISVGFFAALFGGTSTQVSGPTGPMTVVMAAIVASHASDIGQAFTIVMLGGLIQIAFGMLKIGRYVSYTPYSVVSGFMSGIGAIIIIMQVLPFFGLVPAAGAPLNSIVIFPDIISQTNLQALALGILSLGCLLFWPPKFRKYLPAPLVALAIGTLLAAFVLKDAPTLGTIPLGFPEMHFPKTTWVQLPSLLQPALILALLGSIDSLLTSLVADSVTQTQHDSNRELVGQGIGNIAAGLVGGLPGAGATMRTIVNIEAGGRNSTSGMIHAVILLSIVLGLATLVEHIPLAVLAGILLKVGWDIIDWPYLRQIRRAPRAKVIVMLITLFLTIFADLILAVSVGLILASFVTSSWMEAEELKGISSIDAPGDGDELDVNERAILESHQGHLKIISLKGRFSFASARALVTRLGHINDADKHTIVFDLSRAEYFDTSAALALGGLIKATLRAGHDCYVAGVSPATDKTFISLDILSRIPRSHRASTRNEALRRIGFAVDDTIPQRN